MPGFGTGWPHLNHRHLRHRGHLARRSCLLMGVSCGRGSHPGSRSLRPGGEFRCRAADCCVDTTYRHRRGLEWLAGFWRRCRGGELGAKALRLTGRNLKLTKYNL